MRRSSRLAVHAWRRRYLGALLALSAGLIWVAGALADAGNPILNTIQGTAVDNGNGTVTIYVRGQWNWISHNSDCNFDRGATGVGIIWNDPTEPGYTVSKGSISQSVGISSLRSGDTVNTVDRMVHPVDRGNQVEGYTVAGTDYPTGQLLVDPSPPDPNSYLSWKGGCGREPITATASKNAPGGGPGGEATGQPCATGTTACAGHPWGSWGYEKNGGLGYAHTYLKTQLPSQVCANFYDVHGGGKAGTTNFQKVNGAKEITVNGNGDNSIQTNSFNAADGRNCVKFFFPSISTTATGGTFGASGTLSISDKVTLSGASPTATGKITVTMYGPGDANCSGTGTPQDLPLTGADVNHDYTANFSVTQKGDYNFTAGLFLGTSTTAAASSPCGATGETATVSPRPTTLTTNAGTTFKVGAGGTVGLTDTATLSGGTSDGSGTISFELFKDSNNGGTPCDVSQGTASATVNNGADGKQYTSSPAITVGPGQYHWTASYNGDAKNSGTSTACGDTNENPRVINPSIDVSKTPPSQSVAAGGTANFTIKVTNNGDARLTGIVVTDAQAPLCGRTAAQTDTLINAKYGRTFLDPTEFFSYTCSRSPITAPFVNVVEACGQDPLNNQVCDTDTNGGAPPPGCPATEADRCAFVGVADLTSKQNFVPNDTGTLSGLINPTGGKLTFALYKGGCVAANRIYLEQQNVGANGSFDTTNTTTLKALLTAAGLATDTAGTYNWQLTFTGDANNNADIIGACGTENFVVTNG